MRPRTAEITQDDTHRLIAAKYSEKDDSVLTRLTDDVADLQALFELEGATNDRLLGEAGLLPGISLRELVFGLPYAYIVNAAFTHARPAGSRFAGAERGAWYAGFSRETAETEVAYHRRRELQEVRWQEPEVFRFVDFLADFRGEFHDLRAPRGFDKYLDAESYTASQTLGRELLEAGSAGIVYPSVRHEGGTCLACFRPALVTHVRKGAEIELAFESADGKLTIREVKVGRAQGRH